MELIIDKSTLANKISIALSNKKPGESYIGIVYTTLWEYEKRVDQQKPKITEEDITIVEKFSNRIQKFYNQSSRKSDYLLEQILTDFELEILNEQKSKADATSPKSKFMEEWVHIFHSARTGHKLIQDTMFQLAELIDKHKKDK